MSNRQITSGREGEIMIIDGMFDPLIDLVKQFGPEIKLLVSVVIGIIGLALVVKPAGKSLSAFSNKEWMGGITWLLAGLVVIALSIGGIVFIYNVGEDSGDNMKDELGYQQHIEQSYIKDNAQSQNI